MILVDYTVNAGRRGVHSVTAKTRAHAVARLAVRLKLTEAQTEERRELISRTQLESRRQQFAQ